MRSGIAAIDHIILGTRDLEAARANWTRLGFTLTPRGRHSEQPTANYCVMFASDYVELLGAAGARPPAGTFGRFLGGREGLTAAAFAMAAEPPAVAAALRGLGLHPSPPRALARRLELPEGAVEPRFSLIDLPPGETPGLDCFLCGHLTPELLRRPEWLRHPNGALGIAALYVLADDPAALLPAYDRLFGISQVTTTDAVVSVQVGPHRILFLTPDDFLTMHPELDLDAEIRPPAIAALELAVARPAETVAVLRAGGVPFRALGGGLAVPAAAANGAILIFSPR